MKLLNHTLAYLAAVLLPVLAIWAVVFYFEILDEVYDSIDDGLDNYKMLIIRQAQEDTLLLRKEAFRESNYAIRQLSGAGVADFRDSYKDTLMYMHNEEDFEPVRMLTTVFVMPGERYYELKVIASMVEEDDLIENLFYALLLLYGALIVSILLLYNILLRKIWKPFYLLLSQLRHFRLGGTPFAPVKTGVREFQALNDTVQSLLQRSQDTFNSQKQFLENAAHELQTPLAISINRLELLAESPGLAQEQADAVAQVIRTLERLRRLNKSLLLLARIENRQFMEASDISIGDIVSRLTEELGDFARHREVDVRTEISSPITCRMNAGLADTLVANLLKNAIVHNVPGGEVVVRLSHRTLTIENTATSAALDEEKIFGRFYKESAEKSTTGLGLAIVRAIAGIYNIRIGYVYADRHVFTAEFPA